MKWIPSTRSTKTRNRALGLKPCHPISEKRGKGWRRQVDRVNRIRATNFERYGSPVIPLAQKKHDGRKPKAVK